MPYKYDYNVFGVSTGEKLTKKEIWNDKSEQILRDNGLVYGDYEFNEDIGYLLGKNEIYEHNCLKWNSNAQNFYN